MTAEQIATLVGALVVLINAAAVYLTHKAQTATRAELRRTRRLLVGNGFKDPLDAAEPESER